MSNPKKLNQTVQRAKFCKWIAERMIDTTNQILNKHWLVTEDDFPINTSDHVDAEDHLQECYDILSLSKEVIHDFNKFNQTTVDKAEQINVWWEIYGNVPEVA